MTLARSVTRPAGLGSVPWADATVIRSARVDAAVTNGDVTVQLIVAVSVTMCRSDYRSFSYAPFDPIHPLPWQCFAGRVRVVADGAERRPGSARPRAPPGTPPKPLVPVAASSVVKNPDPYVGEYVTLTATVESNLSKTSFSVDQDKTKSTGQEVLVLAPNLQKPADPNGYVTVIGQLIKFDPAEVEKNLKGYTLDLPADVQEKYKGKPVVLATAVINTAGIDIAKKPIPPMSADDLALQKIMTKLPPAQAALRKAMDGKDLNLVKEQAAILKTAFTETEAFWKAKGNTEAMTIAGDGEEAR